MTFIPHAILLVIWCLWTFPAPFIPGTDIVFVVTAAVLPIWAAWVGRKQPLLRALVLGPGVALAAGVAWWLSMAGDERDWLSAMLLAMGLALFAVHSAIVFAIAARLRR